LIIPYITALILLYSWVGFTYLVSENCRH